MRLWSINFRYLDGMGLVALWRESLLARAVLEGRTVGYRRHPQLLRFREYRDPLAAINTYLYYVHRESINRGYRFDGSRIDAGRVDLGIKIPVTQGQLDYELALLRRKLAVRSPEFHESLRGIVRAEPNDLFVSVPGDVEGWERVRPELRGTAPRGDDEAL
ncbi:pyrimidine dimer DNA glycosylase/endonuclease V [Conexivisphaera calida]|uniref:Pyrimidine dimer DNA glycosylase n=1 Tax=Conexivisphaera calida TaxID=1874277 RepID=A0A4P2VD75_9ARCH|nr:pyrimidine dimer DNA glycosylase/endonuclease V [Conexivisphaera calida]BBE42101.1 Pyrimidine dimer DNA glycosylase [Conexivisphaera calida]